MPIVTTERYKEMFKAARDGGFAYPAVNVTSSSTVLAALEGFSEAESDGIIQPGAVQLDPKILRDGHAAVVERFAEDARHYLVFHGGSVLKVDGEVGNKKVYDPRSYMRKAEQGMTTRVVAACEQLRSAGRTLG